MKQVHAIDLMKFIFSILVIVVHTYPFYETLPDIGFISSNILGRIIIPFFFISSGYFFDKGTERKQDYFKQYMKRMIRLYLIWSILCLPFGIHYVNRMLEIKGMMWIGAFVAGIFYAGTYYHLWYMAALIFAIAFCVLWLKRFSFKSLLICGMILFAIGCSETYYGLLEMIGLSKLPELYFSLFYTTRNGLFFGILYVALGIFISRNDFHEKVRFPLQKAIFFFLLLFIEAQTVRHLNWSIDYNMYFMAVPFMFYWFCWLIKLNCGWKLNYRSLREYSTIIYFVHGIFLETVPWILGNEYGWLYQIGIFRLCSVLLLTLISAWFIKHYLPALSS